MTSRTRSCCTFETSGPRCVVGASGSPSGTNCAKTSSSPHPSSSRERGTSWRVGVLQVCPEVTRQPDSEPTAPSATRRPAGARRAGGRDHVDELVAHHRLADHRPGAGHEVDHRCGSPTASTTSASRWATPGTSSDGVSTTVRAATSAGGDERGRDRRDLVQPGVPRRDGPDDADRLRRGSAGPRRSPPTRRAQRDTRPRTGRRPFLVARAARRPALEHRQEHLRGHRQQVLRRRPRLGQQPVHEQLVEGPDEGGRHLRRRAGRRAGRPRRAGGTAGRCPRRTSR